MNTDKVDVCENLAIIRFYSEELSIYLTDFLIDKINVPKFLAILSSNDIACDMKLERSIRHLINDIGNVKLSGWDELKVMISDVKLGDMTRKIPYIFFDFNDDFKVVQWDFSTPLHIGTMKQTNLVRIYSGSADQRDRKSSDFETIFMGRSFIRQILTYFTVKSKTSIDADFTTHRSIANKIEELASHTDEKTIIFCEFDCRDEHEICFMLYNVLKDKRGEIFFIHRETLQHVTDCDPQGSIYRIENPEVQTILSVSEISTKDKLHTMEQIISLMGENKYIFKWK